MAGEQARLAADARSTAASDARESTAHRERQCAGVDLQAVRVVVQPGTARLRLGGGAVSRSLVDASRQSGAV